MSDGCASPRTHTESSAGSISRIRSTSAISQNCSRCCGLPRANGTQMQLRFTSARCQRHAGRGKVTDDGGDSPFGNAVLLEK